MKELKKALMTAATEIDENEEAEDAAYIYRKAILNAAYIQISAVAKRHASKPDFDDGTFKNYNDENEILHSWCSFFPEQKQRFHNNYDVAFDMNSPRIKECGKCAIYFIESNCPNCSQND